MGEVYRARDRGAELDRRFEEIAGQLLYHPPCGQ
jgi:hypothetical protein